MTETDRNRWVMTGVEEREKEVVEGRYSFTLKGAGKNPVILDGPAMAFADVILLSLSALVW